MAQAFNLTAQLNLQGPANIGRIVSDIKKQIGTIEGEVKFKVDASTAKNIAQLNSSLQSFNSTLSNTTSVASNAARALSDLRSSISGINVKSMASDIKAASAATDTLGSTSKKASKDIQSARTELEEFGRQSALAIRRFTAFSVVSGIMFKVSNSINQGLVAAIDFERQLVRLEQITGKSQQGLQSLSDTISNLSTSLGVSSSSLIGIADTLAQAGLSARDTETALKALALTELAPSFDSLNETVEGSIALMRQFDISASDLQNALGSINSVAARFAVESSDLITAIQRTGGVFATASKGVSEGTNALNEFLAVFTSVRATTRESAETIATGLRTIFTRIQREDTIEALEAYGVQLTDVEGKFIGAYRAVEQLSRGLGQLDPRSIEFSAIVEELGGFRQIGKVIPLIQQFSVAQEALKVAQTGQDSLAYDSVTAQKSLANQIVKVREEFLALIREIGQSDAFQTLAKGALSFASALISITDTVKGVLPILAIIGLRKGISATTQFGKGFIGGLKKVQSNEEDGGGGIAGNVGRTVGETLSGARSERAARSSNENVSALNEVTNSMTQLADNINANINALQNNTSSLLLNTASIDALTLAINSRSTPGTLNSGGKVLGFSSGGSVPGNGNNDSVPAMLTPGEFVINKKAAQAIGSKTLHQVNRYANGGIAKRKIGYIDYDVIANETNKSVVEQGMMSSGVTGPRLYTEYLTDLAIKARKNSDLQKLRAIYGVAGSGKTTLARGQGTDIGTLRQTERFPILSPQDIQNANEVIVLSSSVSKDKLDTIFSEADRAYTLSSTTAAEKEKIKEQRLSRDITGIGLEGRTPGTTTGVAIDTAVSEALLTETLGSKSVVLGRTESGRLRRKSGDELVDIIKKKIGFTWGGFAPMTAGHESIMDAASAMGIPPEDFIYLVGANEGIKTGDASSYRTAVFDQDARVLLAKAGAGTRGATVLPKPRDFEVPQAFDISGETGRRQVLVPSRGSMAFVADKTEAETAKYKEAGYGVANIERSGGISGTMVRDLIMSGDLGKLQSVLSPNVYDLISNNIGKIQNRANILPSIIQEVNKIQGIKIDEIEQQIKALGISRIDTRKVASDPEYAAKVEILRELRSKRDKTKSAASFEPYRLLALMAAKEPNKYGLDFSLPSQTDIKPIRTVSKTQKVNIGGLIKKFANGGYVVDFDYPDSSSFDDDILNTGLASIASDATKQFDLSGRGVSVSVNDLKNAMGNNFNATKGNIYELAVRKIAGNISPTVKGDFDYAKWDPGSVKGFDTIPINTPTDAKISTQAASKAEFRKKIANYQTNTGDLEQNNFGAVIFEPNTSDKKSAIKISQQEIESYQKKNYGGLIQKFVDGGMVEKSEKMTEEIAAVKNRAEILNFFKERPNGLEDAARSIGIRSADMYEILGKRNPDASIQTLQEAIRREYVKAYNKRISAEKSEITKLEEKGLVFGAAGIFGSVSKPTNLDIVSDKLSKTARVRVISGVMNKNIADQLDALLTQGISDLVSKGARLVKGSEPTGNVIQDINAQATAQGVLLEQIIQALGGPGKTKGQGFDFPNGLQDAAQYFGLPSDIPTDLKRTLEGPRTIQDNIVTYLKNVMGYAQGGKVDYYSLEKNSGFSSGEFDLLANFAKTNGFSLDEFKKYLQQRLAQKQQNSQLRMNPASLLRAITPETPQTTNRQRALAEQLKGEPDAGYRPILTQTQRIAQSRSDIVNAVRGYANGGTVQALLTPGEAVIGPKLAKKIGYNKLNKMNHAEKNGMGRYAHGGDVSIVPGTGNGDTFGPVALPVGSFVIRKKATKALGFNKGGSIGTTYRFADGGGVPVPNPSNVSNIDPNALVSGSKSISRAAGDLAAAIDYIKSQVISAAKEAAAETYKAEKAKGATSQEALKVAKAIALTTAKAKATDIYKNRTKELEGFGIDPNAVYTSGVTIKNKDVTSLTPADLARGSLGETNPIFGQTTAQIKTESDAKVKEAAKQRATADQVAAKNSTLLSLAFGGLGGIIQQFTKQMEGFGSVLGRVIEGVGSRIGIAREAATTLGSRSTIRGLNVVGEKTGINQLLSKVGLGPLGSKIGFVTKALSVYGQALYVALGAVKDFYNGMLEAEKKLTENRIEQATTRLSYLFDKMTRDIDKSGSIEAINSELNNLASSINRQVELNQRAEFMWTDVLDWLGQSGSLGTDVAERANQRGAILREQGSFAYLTSSLSDLFGVGNARQENYMKLAPAMARSQAEASRPFFDNYTRVIEQRLRSGESAMNIISKDLGSINAPSTQAKALSLQDIDAQLKIAEIKSGTGSQKEKQQAISAIEFESAKNIVLADIKAKEAIIISEKLNKISQDFVTSIERLMNGMDQAINKSTFELQQLSNSAKLSRESLSGKAGAGQVNLQAVNILRNPMAYSSEERASAAKLGATPFGIDAKMVEGLITLPNTLEESMTRAINTTIAEDRAAGEKKISTRVEKAAIDVIKQMNLGSNIESLIIKQTKGAFEEMTSREDDTISFRELAEKIPALTKQIEAANKAQESAIRALEFWQSVLNSYSEAMNRQVQDQIDINNYLRKAADIRTRGEMALSDALGKEVSLRSKINASLAGVQSMTGGETNPAAISANILDLENTRRAEQQAINAMANSSIGVTDNFQLMNEKLALTNLALRENYAALDQLANSSDIASAALSKVQDISNKIKAGETFIEKLVTSSPAEITKLNKSFSLLSNNLQGTANVGSTAEERAQSLQLFNMIAPLLGSGQQQNILKGNVLQSMLQESGVALDSNLSAMIDAIKNPESLTEMQEAIKIYKSGVELQAAANTALSEIKAALSKNDLSIANQQLIEGFGNVMKNYQENQLNAIATNTRETADALKNGVPAVAKSSGGIIYASKGQSIFKPKGTDTVPAMLTPGEFVVNKSAASKHMPLLQSINNGYSNGGKVRYYADGGSVIASLSSEGEGINERLLGTSAKKPAESKISDNKYPTEKYLSNLSESFDKFYSYRPTSVIYGSDPSNISILSKEDIFDEAKQKSSGPQDVQLSNSARKLSSRLIPYIGYGYDSTDAVSFYRGLNRVNQAVSYGPQEFAPTLGTFELPIGASNFDRKLLDSEYFDNISKLDQQKYTEILNAYSSKIENATKPAVDFKDSFITDASKYKQIQNSFPPAKLSMVDRAMTQYGFGSQQVLLKNLYRNILGNARIGMFNSQEDALKSLDKGPMIGFDLEGNVVSGTNRYNSPTENNGVIKDNFGSVDTLTDTFSLLETLTKAKKQLKNDKFITDTKKVSTQKDISRKLLALFNNSTNSIDLSDTELKALQLFDSNNIRNGSSLSSKSIFPIRFYNTQSDIQSKANTDIYDIIQSEYGEDFANFFYDKNAKKILSDKLILFDTDSLVNKQFSSWMPAFLDDKIISGSYKKQFRQLTNIIGQKSMRYTDTSGFEFYYNIIEPYSQIYDSVLERFSETNNIGNKFADLLVNDKLLTIDSSSISANNNPFKGMFGANEQLIIQESLETFVKNIKDSFIADPKNPSDLIDKTLLSIATNPKTSDYRGNVSDSILKRFAFNGNKTVKTLSFNEDFIESYNQSIASKQMKQAQTAAGAVSQDLMTKEIDANLNEAKRTTLARIAYRMANNQGLNLPKNPENIDDIENIRSILNSRIGSINDPTNPETFRLEAWRRLFTEISGTSTKKGKGRSYILAGAGIDVDSISAGGTPKIVPDPAMRGANKTMYWDNTSQEGSTQTILENLLNREINVLRAQKLGADASLSADVAEQARAALKNGKFVKITTSLDGKGMAREIDSQEPVLGTYADIFKYALTPSNIFGTDSSRGTLIDQVKNYYQNAQGKGGLIFEKSYIDTVSTALDTLKSWYANQDFLLNTSANIQDNLTNYDQIVKDRKMVEQYTGGSGNTNPVSANTLLTNNQYGRLPYPDKVQDNSLYNLMLAYTGQMKEPIAKANGGLIYASGGSLINFQPKGTDTVPAMLTPGEFVVNKDSTQKHLGLLRAINSGEYSHGGLVNYLKNGGLLLPNYYQNGARVGPNSAGMSFDISTFMNKIIGQITSSITTAMKDITDKIQTGSTAPGGGVSTNIEAGMNTIDQFVSRLDRIANTLKDLDIPPEIKIVGQHDVNVVINGDAVLNQLKPELASLVMDNIKKAFQQFKGNNSAWQDSFNFDIT